MKLKNLKFISLSILFLVFTGSVFKGEDDIYDKINKNLDVIGKVYREVTLNYVDEIDADKFIKAGIDGMLNTLDPYTSYFDENSRDQIDLITLGKYGGVGITVGFRDSIVTITEIMNGYEAQRKGLRRGDKIIELDGVPVSSMKIEELRKKVRGSVGSPIRMKILRDDETIDFDLTREEIILKNISYTGYIDDKSKGIGYIKLERFTQNSDTEFENSLKTLLATGPLNGLIIDLRGNGGGLLDAAVGILNNLVDKNSLLVIIKGRNINSEKKYFSNKEPLLPKNVPLAVLIDSNTASASEIVAGAIQDLDRGVVIGNTSFGKGLVQQFKDLNPESQLKITLSRYFTPSGRWIQEKNYFKENKSGVFLNKDLFSITEFKTLNGRKVTAFGGITPDVKFGVTVESDIHKDLLDKDIFFRFANNYLLTNQVNGLFRADERTFEEFKSYLNSTGYNYNSPSDKKINDLRKIAAGKNFGDNYNQLLDQLSAQVASEESNELNAAKDEIMKSIEVEINKRQVSESEQIEARFPADLVLMEAVRIITDRSLYDSYLKPF
ncbi:MAG TPA: S41 family peptidase [Bacteroidetes bacterium]|nr:S41 family peptidase [Bacteroidota bacterium]